MSDENKMTSEEFLRLCGRGGLLLALGGTVGGLVARNVKAHGTVWQIDPAKCNQCGQCATHCVLDQSAVKCYHTFAMCGYCDLCTGFFEPQPSALNEGAENQICPVNAIQRSFVEDPYFQYVIDMKRCIGCARCVQGCTQFGNGSLYLQVDQELCRRCNECSIAKNCPAGAFVRLPASQPYVTRPGTDS